MQSFRSVSQDFSRRLLRTRQIRPSAASWVVQHSKRPQNRPYVWTTAVLDDEGGGGEEQVALQKKEEEKEAKAKGQEYNRSRASYERQVSLLRREYAEQVSQQRAADKAEREALEREATRRRLEGQRRKNVRSAYNAMREKQMREERAREFAEHLEREQIKREAREERYARARQKVVDGLEEEAPLWLTSAEEVEAAFTPEAEQLLWTRRGGVLGAHNPSLDAHFWHNETHTWHMTKTYKSQREILLNEIRDLAYEESNVDKSFWTPERIEEIEDLETRARLRAEVQRAGKSELLRRQAQMLNDQYQTETGEIPKTVPAPNLKVLGDNTALEREGAKVLFNDPTRFFVFDKGQASVQNQGDIAVSQDGASEYAGPTLGAPVGLYKTNAEKFPQAVGKLPIPDTRTEREKKQEQREERMLAAARAEEAQSIELAAEEQDVEDLEPDLDYDNNQWEEDDEWEKGLSEDSPEDVAIRQTPASRRYKEDDIEWVLKKLGTESSFLEQQFSMEMEALQQNIRSDLQETASDESVTEDGLQKVLLTMGDKELVALSDLDDAYSAANGDMPATDFSDFATKIPSLTEGQLKFVLDRERDE
jgi:hypothetical protein